jgi:hypothetical protein
MHNIKPGCVQRDDLVVTLDLLSWVNTLSRASVCSPVRFVSRFMLNQQFDQSAKL